jgi:hypothetical protein
MATAQAPPAPDLLHRLAGQWGSLREENGYWPGLCKTHSIVRYSLSDDPQILRQSWIETDTGIASESRDWILKASRALPDRSIRLEFIEPPAGVERQPIPFRERLSIMIGQGDDIELHIETDAPLPDGDIGEIARELRGLSSWLRRCPAPIGEVQQ